MMARLALIKARSKTSGSHRNTAGNLHRGRSLGVAEYIVGGMPDRTETAECLPECIHGSIRENKTDRKRSVQDV
jgi:hypothetical protein